MNIIPKGSKISTITFNDYINWFTSVPIVKAFLQEGKDYKTMVRTFGILLIYKLNIKNRTDLPSPEEIKTAIQHLKGVPKIMPFCAMLLTPIPFLLESYLVIAFLVWKLTNNEINILPNNFKDILLSLEKKKIFNFLNKKTPA